MIGSLRLQVSLGPTVRHDVAPVDRPSAVMSQLGFAAVSDAVQDGVSSVERLADGRLNSAPPALQLRTLLQDISAAPHRLHELTDGEQVGQSDVITTEERLTAKKHGLQFVQSVVELRQSAIQTHLVHLRARLSREEHLQYKDFGSVWSCVVVMPGCVFVHFGASLWLPWIPVLWDVILGGQVLHDGVTLREDEAVVHHDWNLLHGVQLCEVWTSVLSFPQSHRADCVRDFVAAEQDVQRPAGLRQQVQIHLQQLACSHETGLVFNV